MTSDVENVPIITTIVTLVIQKLQEQELQNVTVQTAHMKFVIQPPLVILKPNQQIPMEKLQDQ